MTNSEFRSYLKKFVPLFERLGPRKEQAVCELARWCRAFTPTMEEQFVNLLYLLAELIPHTQDKDGKDELAHSVVKVIEARPDLLAPDLHHAPEEVSDGRAAFVGLVPHP